MPKKRQNKTCRTRSRSNPRSKMMAELSSDDECSSSKGKVVAASDLSGVFQSVGMTRRVPKGEWTTDQLTEAIVNHAEFERKQCVTNPSTWWKGPLHRTMYCPSRPSRLLFNPALMNGSSISIPSSPPKSSEPRRRRRRVETSHRFSVSTNHIDSRNPPSSHRNPTVQRPICIECLEFQAVSAPQQCS